MPETKIIHFTDVHLQDHNPPSRVGSYRQDIMDKLRKVGDIGRSGGVQAYTCGGDWFHDKVPAKTSHSMVNELMSVIKSFGAPCYTILGNHDIRYDRMSTVPEQPIGPLLNSGVLKMQSGVLVGGGKSGAPSVMMHGYEFAEEPDLQAISLSAEDRGKADYHVLSLHVYASERGGTLFGKTRVFSYHELLPMGYDVVLLGHYHADQGVVTLERADGTSCRFVNVGSLSRGDYGDEQLTRVPKCCLVAFSSEGVRTEEIPVGAKPASEVFDLQEKAEVKEKERQASEFVEKLRSSDLVSSSTTDPEEALAALKVDEEAVLRKTREFLAQASILLRKK